jgi:hypothetical protein
MVGSVGEPECPHRPCSAQPELTVPVATVRKNPYVAKAVQHVLEQGEKTGVVQPVTMEPSVGSEGGVGVVIHLLKTREK